MALLVPVAFGPDWVQWVFEAAGWNNRELSHSIPAVVGFAVAIAAVYALRRGTRAVDAIAVAALWVSHWPADFITGKKPTWPGGPDVGLLWYEHPQRDVVLECVLALVCWLVYRAGLPSDRRNGVALWLLLGGLVAMQIGFSTLLGPPL